ncbi:MAG: autotransporter-associated beta strand repeat-containing protein [Planctomycetia bacterium]|nr:autotransporter-associated beta strand repeat-containing protein [Planctomycetia bacterium]
MIHPRRAFRVFSLATTVSLLSVVPVAAQTFNFTSGTQSWNNPNNWTPIGVPNGIDASATFNSPTGTQSVQLNAAITIGFLDITHNGTSNFNLVNGTGGSLTLETSGGDASIVYNGTSATTNVITIGASITLNSNTVVNVFNVAPTGTAGMTFIGAISGNGDFIKGGDGKLTFSDVAKTYSGATIIDQGRLRLTSAGSPTATSSITVNNGGQLLLETGAIWNLGSGLISLNGNGYTDFNTAANGLGALRVNNTSTINNNLDLASDSRIHIAGGTTTISGAFSGASELIKSGLGTIVFSNTSSSHTGNIVIEQGTINYGSGVSMGGGTVTLQQLAGTNTVRLQLNSSQTITNPSTVWTDTTGTRTQNIDLGTNVNTVLTINQDADTYFGNGAISTITGTITGSGSIVKNGPGTLTLTGNNTYNGTTTINDGFISADNESSFGSNPGSFTANRITLNGGGLRANQFALDFSSNRGITLGPAGGTFDNINETISISTGVSGTGSLTKLGAGVLSMSGASSYLGITTVNEGTLWAYGGNNRLPQTTVVILGDGTNTAVFRLGNNSQDANGFTHTISGLTTNGNSLSNAVVGGHNEDSTLVINNSLNFTFSGTLGGGGTFENNLNLVKSGPGTLILTGSSTYRGSTTINGGILVHNSNYTGAAVGNFTVNNTGTLSGTGTINNNVLINAGGTLAPGQSAGRLTVNGNVTFSAASTFLAEVNGTVAGTSYDQLRIGSGGSLSLNNANLIVSIGYNPAFSDRIFLTDNQFAGSILGTFSGLNEGSTVILSNGDYSGVISYLGDFGSNALSGGNDVVIFNIIAIPEPGSIALMGIAGFACLQWYLRRKPVAKVEVESESIEPAAESNETPVKV